MSPSTRNWQDLSTEDFRELDAPNTIALLPVAAVEQHGPHLPVWVDACINAGVVARGLELVPEAVSVLALPMMPIGLSLEHGDFPGTLSLSAETLMRVLTEIGESVAAAGFRKLVLVNSHGGQPQVLDLVAQKLRADRRLLVFPINIYRFFRDPEIFPEEEIRRDIHGGVVETSLMLHLRPDLVRMDKAADFAVREDSQSGNQKTVGPLGPMGFAWQIQDLHPSGACGNAALAQAEKGRALLERAAGTLAEALLDIHGLNTDVLKDGPAGHLRDK